MTKKPQIELTQAEWELIEKAKPDLQYSESVTGVDWKILAGILYRENSLRTTVPGRPGGVWQFDDHTLTPKRKRQLLDKYSNLISSQKDYIVNGGWQEFRWGSIMASCFLRDKTSTILDVRKRGDLPDSEVGDALYSYNGKAYGSDWKKSPYVFNNGDSNHIGLKLTGSMPNPNGIGRQTITYPDTRMGAFVVYRQLKDKYPRI